MSTTRKRIAVMISGRGSNMEALIEACAEPDFPGDIVLVLSNRPDAAGLETARRAGILTVALDHRTYADRAAHEDAVCAALDEAAPDVICLAGYMRLLGAGFVEHYAGRMINIHPSLLPLFPGLHTHERALAAGMRLHGCTVHYVTAGMDEGPIIAQAAIPVRAGDDAQSLASRLLSAEHRLYPHALRLILSGAVRWQDGTAVHTADLAPADATAGMLISPT